MGDRLSNHLNSWEGALNTTLEESHSDVMELIFACPGLGVFAFILVFCLLLERLKELFCSENDQLEDFQDVHTVLALLPMDVVHIAVTILYAIDLSKDCVLLGPNSCLLIHSVWILSKYFMMLVHLITALKYICYLRDPPSERRLRFMAPLTFVLFLIFAAVYLFLTPYIVIILGPVAIGLIFAIMLKNSGQSSNRTKRIGVVPIISFLFAFLPSFVFHCLVVTHLVSVTAYYFNFQFFTNVQLIFDAILCFFILMLPVKEDGETSTTHYGGCFGDIGGGGDWGSDGGDCGGGGGGGGGDGGD